MKKKRKRRELTIKELAIMVDEFRMLAKQLNCLADNIEAYLIKNHYLPEKPSA
jgi:hypothetical protein